MNNPIQIVVYDIPVRDVLLPTQTQLALLGNSEPQTHMQNAHADILRFFKQQDIRPGGTQTLTPEQHSELEWKVTAFLEANKSQGSPIHCVDVGGNGMNKLHHMAVLLQEQGRSVEAGIVGLVGNDAGGAVLTKKISEIPATLLNGGVTAQHTKTSIVMPMEEDRAVAKYPFDEAAARAVYRNMETVLNPLKKANVVLLESKLANYGSAGVLNAFLSALEEGTILAYTPPAEGNQEVSDFARKAAARADVLALNAEEAVHFFVKEKGSFSGRVEDWEDPYLTSAIEAIRDAYFSEESPENDRNAQKVVLITHGKQGALAITKEHRVQFDAPPLEPDQVVNTLGAGDSFAATFLAHYVQRRQANQAIDEDFLMTALESATHVAQAVVQQSGAQLAKALIVPASRGEVPPQGQLLVPVAKGQEQGVVR